MLTKDVESVFIITVFEPKERVTSSDESDNNFPISLIDFLGIIPDMSPEILLLVELVDIASL